MGAGVGLAAFEASPAGAAVPVSKSFDLSASSFAVMQGTSVHFSQVVMQCFAFDQVNKHIYVAQVTGSDATGTYAQHKARGDLTINKLDFAGNYLAWMKVEGCGHGFSMGVSNNADGSPEIWLEFRADTANLVDGAAYGRMVTHTPWANSTTRTADFLATHLHNARPGTYHNSCAIDPTNNRIAIRYQPVLNNAAKKVAIFKLSDFLASNYGAPLADIALPASCYTAAQGFTLWGDYLYFLSGAPQTECAGTQAASTSKLTKINVNSKVVTGPVNTFAFWQLANREPEGMAIQLFNGTPRLTFGFAAHDCPDAARTVNIAYKDVLTATAD